MSEEKATFDFASIENYVELQDQGREIAIALSNGVLTDLKINVCGPDSDRVRKAVRWGQDQFSSRENLSDDARAEIQMEVAARCCSGWSGARFKGEDEVFSVEALKRWIRRWPFIQPQISAATGNGGRFITA